MVVRIGAVVLLSIALFWSAINKAGVEAQTWFVSLGLIGIASMLYWVLERGGYGPPLALWVSLPVSGAFAYMAFQLIPLPLSLLQAISPARAEIAQSLTPIAGKIGAAPIAVNSPAALLWTITLLSCLATFFLIREITWRTGARTYVVLIPLFLVAAFEAVVGLIQVSTGSVWAATGTFNSHDHYCCLLEMILPLSVTYGLSLLRRSRSKSQTKATPVVLATTMWSVSVLLLAAIFYSLSRAGSGASLAGLAAVALLIFAPKLPSHALRVALGASLAVVVGLALIFLTPGALLERLVHTMTPNSEARLAFWRESIPLLQSYRWTGVGFLGFASTYPKYQATMTANLVDFTHNDYLEYLIELGVPGFLLAMSAIVGLLQPIFAAAWNAGERNQGRRYMLIGCVGTVVALALHEIVDFNMYVPTDMLVFAWIAGLGSAKASEQSAGV